MPRKSKTKESLGFGVIFGSFQGRAVAPGTVSNHLTDPQKKIQGGLDLSCDSFLDGLIPDVFLTTFLLGLSMDRKL